MSFMLELRGSIESKDAMMDSVVSTLLKKVQ